MTSRPARHAPPLRLADMQASTSIPTGPAPVAPRFNRRLVTAAVIVVLGHAALITVALLMPPKELPQPKLESTMTVQLISQPAPTPVAVESKPTPQPPKPVDKPKVVPKPVLKPKPTPLPVATAPSEHAIEAPEPTPAPPAPPAPPTPAAPPAPRPTLAIAAPAAGPKISCQMVQPPYPTLSRRRGETGTVSIYFEVSVGGQIEKARVTKSSDFPRLDTAALDAVNASSCKPYIENGQPVRARYTQNTVFNLDGE